MSSTPHHQGTGRGASNRFQIGRLKIVGFFLGAGADLKGQYVLHVWMKGQKHAFDMRGTGHPNEKTRAILIPPHLDLSVSSQLLRVGLKDSALDSAALVWLHDSGALRVQW